MKGISMMSSVKTNPTSTQAPKDHYEVPIGEIEVRPSEQAYMPLGHFQQNELPIGFSLQLNPQNTPASVVTSIISESDVDGYPEYSLRIHNRSDIMVSVEVWCLY
jgi:hypothetical protein